VPFFATLLGAALLTADPTQAPPPEPPPAAAASQPSPSPDDEDETEKSEEPKGGAGVSPVEIIPKVELREAFTKLDSGVSLHVSTFQMDIQFLRRILLRYQAPLGVMETPAGQVSGIGDLQFTLIGVVASNARAVAILIAGTELNTATQPPLGTGKTQLLFGAGAAYKPYRFLLPYLVAWDEFSVAGESTRPSLNQLTADLGSVLFGRQYNWLKADLTTTVDFPGGAVGRLYGQLEVGSLVIGRVGLFARTGTQLAGPRLIDYTAIGGLRYLFKLEKGKPAR
jgi:hypothetical protein